MSYKKSVFRSLTMVTQLGLSVVTPIFLCIFAGYQIDSRFQTNWMIPLLILGTLSGARCAWVMAMNILRSEEKDDERLKQEQRKEQPSVGAVKPKEPSRIRRVQSDESAQPDSDKEMDQDGLA